MIKVSGRVSDLAGEPVPGAAVTLAGSGGPQIARNAADQAGGFTARCRRGSRGNGPAPGNPADHR
ncbi:MAG TPA: carboxypeptidase-like regulatory domain-containing protein [Amycolatopsis sp.]|uniref:carboxypeptidase-like regulatory domain-containing protein n=1 Tax=Amycolatopsis sp. TaxID=37632 RepID=UPI002B47BBD5|nr:carboxypeptidase-like regulatory domain-containing protein [Amycolatopsis sp.]HKS45945.1 carboxypeptidase-like regulatory domain-containing protein [Amycolatopsis sp.]